MRWFKFYGQDWLTDLKVIKMSAVDRLCFITLLCLASSEDNNGSVKNISEETLIQLSHLNESEKGQAVGCLERYKALQSVTLGCNGVVTVSNFTRRQGENLSNAERQKRYRDSKKTVVNKGLNKKLNSNERNVTRYNDSNTRIEENRIDKNIDIVADATPFSFEEELNKLKTSSRVDHKIIALYWNKKKFVFDNKKQFTSALKRELRPASSLTGYTGEQVGRAMKYCQDNYQQVGWTLETVSKRIAELVNKK